MWIFDVLSAIRYPHWLMIAGAVLVAFGFIGFALAKNKAVENDATERIDGRNRGTANRNKETTR